MGYFVENHRAFNYARDNCMRGFLFYLDMERIFGNRAVSSRCGAADVLEALGVNLELAPDRVAACVAEIGIGFLFAPKLHRAMKHAIGPRREIGIRTIFNILGPLTNRQAQTCS